MATVADVPLTKQTITWHESHRNALWIDVKTTLPFYAEDVDEIIDLNGNIVSDKDIVSIDLITGQCVSIARPITSCNGQIVMRSHQYAAPMTIRVRGQIIRATDVRRVR